MSSLLGAFDCVLPPFPLFLEFCASTRPQELLPFLVSETWLKFRLHCRNQGEIRPGNRACPVNRPAHVKI